MDIKVIKEKLELYQKKLEEITAEKEKAVKFINDTNADILRLEGAIVSHNELLKMAESLKEPATE